jgi:hypothetical protein
MVECLSGDSDITTNYQDYFSLPVLKMIQIYNRNTNVRNLYKKLPYSGSELYQPSEGRLSAKLVPTYFADRGSRVARTMDPYGRILGFLDLSRYFYSFSSNSSFVFYSHIQKTNFRFSPVLSSERALYLKKKESNCHSKKCKIWSSAPKGAQHQDELAD